MPLTYLLYRCPRCGHDPLEGKKDEARCSRCGTHFSRGGAGGLIRVRDEAGTVQEVPGHRLTAAMEARAAQEATADPPGDALIRESAVRVRQSGMEAPVHWKGGLLGFAEAMGEPREGILRLTPEALTLREGPWAQPGTGGGNGTRNWPILEIRAVQTSSSSVQFSPASGGLVELRFLADSPFRWEALLRETLRQAYRRAGLGEIVEFQPRVVAE